PLARKLHLAIHSYDLHSPSPHVTRADIANLPLADGAADVAIFCLALMGTNWLDFIEEAYRILRWKGELWVAEIKSRFGPAARHAGAKGRSGGGVVEHSVGNRKKTEKVGKKDKAEIASAEAAADGEELAVEVDGNDDKRGETDVSAFVEALQKRGFVLQGKADLSNKMFVRMRFTKGMAPVKGKCVEKTPKEAKLAALEEEEEKLEAEGYYDSDEEIDDEEEATVLAQAELIREKQGQIRNEARMKKRLKNQAIIPRKKVPIPLSKMDDALDQLGVDTTDIVSRARSQSRPRGRSLGRSRAGTEDADAMDLDATPRERLRSQSRARSRSQAAVN
ncbi:hypothetical protein BN1708_016339, partial [Verticillium longisporum]